MERTDPTPPVATAPRSSPRERKPVVEHDDDLGKPRRPTRWQKIGRKMRRFLSRESVSVLVSLASLSVAVVSLQIARQVNEASLTIQALGLRYQTMQLPSLQGPRHSEEGGSEIDGKRTLRSLVDYYNPSPSPVMLEEGWLEIESGDSHYLECSAEVLEANGSQIEHSAIQCDAEASVPGRSVLRIILQWLPEDYCRDLPELDVLTLPASDDTHFGSNHLLCGADPLDGLGD